MEQLEEPHRIMNFSTKGVVRYNPDRGTLKAGNDNWVVIESLEDELSDYYRHQFFKRYGIQLEKPSWSPHISVIKGWPSETERPWGWRDGEVVDFEYSHQMFWKKHFVWVNTKCPVMYEIQEYYGFNRIERGHLTIGRIPSRNLNDMPRFCDYKDLDLWSSQVRTPF